MALQSLSHIENVNKNNHGQQYHTKEFKFVNYQTIYDIMFKSHFNTECN